MTGIHGGALSARPARLECTMKTRVNLTDIADEIAVCLPLASGCASAKRRSVEYKAG